MLYCMPAKWLDLLITYDSLEAEMIKDVLESGGIDVVLQSFKITPYPVNIGKIGEIKVMVKEEDKEIAEEVLRKFIEREKADEQQ